MCEGGSLPPSVPHQNHTHMKVTIEIEVHDGIDLEHAYQSVTDAMYFSNNVTQKEHNLVESFISQLQSLVDISVTNNKN